MTEELAKEVAAVVNRMNRGQKNYMNNYNRSGSSCNSCGDTRNYSRNSCNDARNYSCNANYKELMSKLQAVDFSLVDTILYLDAYPHCQKALSYYKELLEKREMLLLKLKEAGVPLNSMSNFSDTWNWTDAPWPWEYEAN